MQTDATARQPVITFPERADFENMKSLMAHSKQLVLNADKQATHVHIDLRKTEYIDSSGLGVMLIIRDRCKERKLQPVIVVHDDSRVMNYITVACFERLFEIERV